MKFVPMLGLLGKALSEGYAVPSFYVWNAESMVAVLRAAVKLEAPVILMNGPGEFPLLHPADMAAIARSLHVETSLPVALHLDHGDSLSLVRDCLDVGYTSVMLDFSSKPLEENARALQTVVGMAHPLGVTVEGEIGSVGKIEDSSLEGNRPSTLTDPQEACEYVRITGVDTLAISIGNAHGNYTELPRLRFDILEEVFALVNIPLVLHGSSGTPDEDINKAISLGIAKINVASELVRSVRESLLEQWKAGQNLWVPSAEVEAMKDMESVVMKWIIKTGAAGRAQ